MSNVKQVIIIGWFSDPIESNPELDEFQKLIGSLNMPNFGLNFEWTGHEKRDKEKNQYGGYNFSYKYVISGAEAVAFNGLRHMVKKLQAIGTVEKATANDIENGEEWVSVA